MLKKLFICCNRGRATLYELETETLSMIDQSARGDLKLYGLEIKIKERKGPLEKLLKHLKQKSTKSLGRYSQHYI